MIEIFRVGDPWAGQLNKITQKKKIKQNEQPNFILKLHEGRLQLYLHAESGPSARQLQV